MHTRPVSAPLILSTVAASFLVVNPAHATESAWPRLPSTNLLVYHDRKGEVRPVQTKADWQKRRAEIVRGFESVAGALPGRAKLCPLDVRVEARKDCGSYERQLITYQAEPGSRVPAYLLVPKPAAGSRAKLAAVLCLHPTDSQYGHRVAVEPMRDYYRAYAHDLAERGFVVLAPSYPLLANYQPDIRALGYRSGTMKAIWDNRRGLDLLDSLPFVKHKRYGVLGHSLGGHNAIFTALFDDRLKVIVTSCGFDSFLDYAGGKADLWEPERGWCQTRYMPALADYRGRLADIPFDFPELLGALAPRDVFISAPLHDDNFRARSVDTAVAAALPIFRLCGAEQNLRLEHPDCGHDFPEAERAKAYRLLEEKLR